MSMTATTRPIGNGITQEVDVNGRHMLVTDEPERLGGADLGPAPHELLAAMLASCVSTMIALYARNRGWELGKTSVEVVYDPDSTPRGVSVAVHLPGDLSHEQRVRLERVARTCPARRALEAGFTFEETFLTEERDDARTRARTS